MMLSDPDAHPRGRHGGLCAIHSWDCTNRVAPINDPSSRRRRRASHLGGHRPHWGAGDTSNGVHLHWSTGPTPRTATTLPTSHAPSLAASGPPLALPSSEVDPLGSGTGSQESVRQSVTQSVRSPRRPIRQRPSTRVLGLNDRA
jgi:hypothetical protein